MEPEKTQDVEKNKISTEKEAFSLEPMNRITRILQDEEFIKRMKEIAAAETERIFCRHGIEHLLSVARIAYIENLETGLGLERDVIYAAALLHDIGRYSSLEKEMSHHAAGAILAENILIRSGFSEEETKPILSAIAKHKKKENGETVLEKLLYEADKLSRNCFLCTATIECYWDEQRKNHTILR